MIHLGSGTTLFFSSSDEWPLATTAPSEHVAELSGKRLFSLSAWNGNNVRASEQRNAEANRRMRARLVELDYYILESGAFTSPFTLGQSRLYERGFTLVSPDGDEDGSMLAQIRKIAREASQVSIFSYKCDASGTQMVQTEVDSRSGERIGEPTTVQLIACAYPHTIVRTLGEAACRLAHAMAQREMAAYPIVVELFRRVSTLAVAKRSPPTIVVVEGMDGVGKSTLAHLLASKLGATYVKTPPVELSDMRAFFDALPEECRRPFYCLSNYLAVAQYDSSNVLVVDRFWASTVAYTVGHLVAKKLFAFEELAPALAWPDDLCSPAITVLLHVDEDLRARRIYARDGAATTAEDQLLGESSQFRSTITRAFSTIAPEHTLSIDASGTSAEVLANTFSALSESLWASSDHTDLQHGAVLLQAALRRQK